MGSSKLSRNLVITITICTITGGEICYWLKSPAVHIAISNPLKSMLISSPSKQTYSLKIYRDSKLGFEFKYQSNFHIFLGDSPDFPIGNFFRPYGGLLIQPSKEVTVVIPKKEYPNTNFQSAFFSVAFNPMITDLSECQEFLTYGKAEKLTEREIINSVIYFRGITGGVAAGIESKTKIFHALHRERCYEITLTIIISNLAYYEPATVKALNEDEVWKRLEEILSTFKFIK